MRTLEAVEVTEYKLTEDGAWTASHIKGPNIRGAYVHMKVNGKKKLYSGALDFNGKHVEIKSAGDGHKVTTTVLDPKSGEYIPYIKEPNSTKLA